MYRLGAYFRIPDTSAIAGDPWERLSLYESRDMVDQLYRDRHDREINDSKARAIASHMLQGRQYFESARNAGDLVRPLLLYYGVVALSRGLILFLDPKLRVSEIKPGHGLGSPNWTSILGENNVAARNVLDLEVRASGGTFSSLANVTANDEHTSIFEMSKPPELWDIGDSPSTKAINWVAKGTMSYGSGATFSIRDVLGRLPDLVTLYESSLKKHAWCYRTDVAIVRRGVSLTSNPAESYLLDVFRSRVDLPSLEDLAVLLHVPHERLHVRADDSTGSYQLELTHHDEVRASALLPPLRLDSKGNNYLMAPLGSNVLSTLSLLYIASYFTGMMVRYHPTTWQLMTSMRSGDRALPLIRAATALVERRYPFEILERLERVWPVDSMIEQPQLSVPTGTES